MNSSEHPPRRRKGLARAIALVLPAAPFVAAAAVGASSARPATSTSRPALVAPLEITWTVDEPLRVVIPPAPPAPAPEVPVLVTLRVKNDADAKCASDYEWRLTPNTPPATGEHVLTHRSCVLETNLAPGTVYDVAVIRAGASPPGSTGDAEIRVGRLLVVSFGDSVASGEGNSARTLPHWEGDPSCHRSVVAGPRQAAERIASSVKHEVVTFLHLACTGAWIDGIGAPSIFGTHRTVLPRDGERAPSELEQYEQLAPVHDGPPIVLLSVGANDLGFGTIITFCLTHRRCDQKQFKELSNQFKTLDALVDRRLGELRKSYARLAAMPPFRNGTVFLTEYFDPLHNGSETCSIAILRPVLQITVDEARWADRTILKPLNTLVAEQATDWGWHFVGGVAQDFSNHGYCAKESWIVPLPLHRIGSRRYRMGAFHPNRRGQDDYGRRIFSVVEPFLPS